MNILAFLHRIIEPPKYTDPEQNRLARTLHLTLILGVFLAGGYSLMVLPTVEDISGTLISGIMAAVFAILFIVLRQGKTQFVSVTLIFVSYLAVMISLFLNGGIRDEAVLVLIGVLALAGFFLGERITVSLGILTVVIFLVLFIGERTGFVTENEHLYPVDWDELLLALLAVVITTTILRQLITQIVTNSQHIRQQADALQEKNEALLKTQQALMAAKEEAEAANQAKNVFLSRLSHDLRTPLNSMMGFTNVLLDEPSLSPEVQADWLRRIQNNGEYMQRMINDLLDLSRIEAGKLQLYPVRIPLIAFLMEVVMLIQMAIQQKSFQFVYQFDEELPAFVYADETRLRQILVNLLNNAIKFTPQGSVRFRVRPLPGTATHQPVLFEVIDTGIGIPEADLARIFEPFEQAGSNAQREKGTGLGLTISSQLVELLGGKLQVESQVNKGSRFWFELTFSFEA
jgi:signal transduction histidine kinase